MIRATAPGKIILFGEHAVVYGRPALAAPVTQVNASVGIEVISTTGLVLCAPGIGLNSELSALDPDNPLVATVKTILTALGAEHLAGARIEITSSIPIASGLGSGAAISVALTRALAQYLGKTVTDEQVNAIAFETEKLHHGTPSGIDNTVITYARPVFFVRRQSIEPFHAGAAFTIVIGNTGIAAPTIESVGDVRKLWLAETEKYEKVFDQIGNIALKAKFDLESGNFNNIGTLMKENHRLLQTLTVSSPELDRLVSEALKAGASGAKLSGGGRGGNMIALVNPSNAGQVAGALESAGAKSTIITQIQ